MITATVALAGGCAGIDARALVPSVVVSGAAERRVERDGSDVRERAALRAVVGLAWRDPSARRMAELVAEPEPSLEDPRSISRVLFGTMVAALLLAAPAGALGQDLIEVEAVPEPALDPARISRAMRRYGHEPRPDQVVRAAIRTGALDPARARRLAERARAAGWVPWLRFTGRRGQARDLDIRAADTGVQVSTDDQLAAEASLTFRLDRLVFAPEEVPLLREERTRVLARHELIRAVLHVYFERRRLQLERDLLGRGGIEIEARIAEAEAVLDAFTAGAFGRMMRPP